MQNEELFLLKKFREYYSKHTVSEPPEPEQREFGIGEFGKKITQRHLSFSSQEEFNSFLKESTPFFVSYSNALYKKPGVRPMAAKEFIAGDLIYEFDADDIKTECKKQHDSWACSKCGTVGKGAISQCTKCGTSVKVEQWFCSECLGEAKKQVFSLLEFLEKDFGFTNGIAINFSGSAGYHIHLRSPEIRNLRRNARIELLDFLTGSNIDFARIGFMEKGKLLSCPSPASIGWGGKLLLELKSLLVNSSSEKIAAIAGMRHSKVKEFLEKKPEILARMEKGMLFSYPGRKNREFWLSLINFVLEQKRLDIDRQTSIDMHKIIRVPDTIHGGTGMLAKKISLEALKKFNPFNDALAFSGEETVNLKIPKTPKFSMGNQSFGPFENSEEELPLNAAIYLLAKQKAVLF